MSERAWDHRQVGAFRGSAQVLGDPTKVVGVVEGGHEVVKRLAPEVEREVHRLHAKGHSLREIEVRLTSPRRPGW